VLDPAAEYRVRGAVAAVLPPGSSLSPEVRRDVIRGSVRGFGP
jgi:hypothetical protein